MPTYYKITSTRFVSGSPDQIDKLMDSLTRFDAVNEVQQVDFPDLPKGVTPMGLEGAEAERDVEESPQAWADLAMVQLTRLGVSLTVTPVLENESLGYGGSKYGRLLWLGNSTKKVLFTAVDLLVALNRLTPAQVEFQGFWESVSHLVLDSTVSL